MLLGGDFSLPPSSGGTVAMAVGNSAIEELLSGLGLATLFCRCVTVASCLCGEQQRLYRCPDVVKSLHRGAQTLAAGRDVHLIPAPC